MLPAAAAARSNGDTMKKLRLGGKYRDHVALGELLEVIKLERETAVVYVHGKCLSCRIINRAILEERLNNGGASEIN